MPKQNIPKYMLMIIQGVAHGQHGARLRAGTQHATAHHGSHPVRVVVIGHPSDQAPAKHQRGRNHTRGQSHLGLPDPIVVLGVVGGDAVRQGAAQVGPNHGAEKGRQEDEALGLAVEAVGGPKQLGHDRYEDDVPRQRQPVHNRRPHDGGVGEEDKGEQEGLDERGVGVRVGPKDEVASRTLSANVPIDTNQRVPPRLVVLVHDNDLFGLV